MITGFRTILFPMVFIYLLLFFGCKTVEIPTREVAEEVEEKENDDELVEAEEIAVKPEPVEKIDLAPPEELAKEFTESGIEYIIFEHGAGIKLSPEMHVSIHYSGYLGSDNTLFDSSFEREQPIEFILGRAMVIPGWEEALTYLRVGDKARLWVPSDLAYGDKGRGPIPPDADLVFDVQVLDAQKIIVPEMISLEHKDTLETDSGLQIIYIHEGTGNLPARGSVLVVHYSGFLSDGSLFDSSVQRGVPFRFVLGAGQVIRGWDEGFGHLSKGAMARFVLPPHLAYGERGLGPIPPNETLVFDVELIDIEY